MLNAISSGVDVRRKAVALTVEDVFSAYLYTGTGVAQDIVNDIDGVDNEVVTWIKNRTTAGTSHQIYNTLSGAGKPVNSDTTNAEGNNLNGLSAFNVDGFSVGTSSLCNAAAADYASWTFRVADRFYNQQLISHTTGTPTVVDLSSLVTVGRVDVKNTGAVTDWLSWHKDLTAGSLLHLNTTAAEAVDASISVSGTNLTIASALATGTYIVYAYAHDPLGPSGDGSDGLIACGSYTGNDVLNEISLGWEAQYILIKRATGGTGQWCIYDTMRGMSVNSWGEKLEANTSDVEASLENFIWSTADGFAVNGGNNDINGNTFTYIYMAIRRPMREPTDATEVFAIDTVAHATSRDIGFVPDSAIFTDGSGVNNKYALSRLSGKKYLNTNLAAAEAAAVVSWDDPTNFWQQATSTSNINLFWKRATGFFDDVAYEGDGIAGRTVDHNLGVPPEMIWVKERDGLNNWNVYAAPIGNTELLILDTTSAKITVSTPWNNTTPADSVFTLGTAGSTNGNTKNFIAYLFATLAGISKVDSYTGNGTSQTIDCGFAAGARFVLVKRTDSTGDWYFWDTTRGIIAGNDPHLSLNTTAAEVTTDDSIDPESTGFIVNQLAATNINVNLAEYIFYAIA